MNRRTFIKCMGGAAAAFMVSEMPVFSGIMRLSTVPVSMDDSSRHRIFYGRDGGCSAPAVADDADVALENGLIELNSRVI